MQKKSHPLLGAHMSIAGGFSQSIIRGESIGCTAIQIFTKSNRQWYSKPPSPEEIQDFIATKKRSSVECVVAHASYLINLASPDNTTHQKSMLATINELKLCEELQIPLLVMHPGSYTLSNSQAGCKAVAQALNQVLDKVPGNCIIALETMAGQGTCIGSNFTELALIKSLVTQKNRVGICVDTCHIFAAGYQFSTPESYKKLWADFDAILGLSSLKVIHLNDSKKECNSRVDRHENIGNGAVGLEAFKLIMNDPKLSLVPKILETPKSTLQDDVENMEKLRKLIRKEK